MSSWFHLRGCPKHFVQKVMKKINFTKIDRVRRQKGTRGIAFVVTYHPLLKSFIA